MTHFLDLPNFLWKIENFITVDRLISPTLQSVGLNWRMKFSHFSEDEEKIRLTLERLSAFDTVPTPLFKTETSLVDMSRDDWNEDRDFLQTSKYNLDDNEWCIWTEDVKKISKHMSGNKSLYFSVLITFSHLDSLCKILKNVEVNDFEDESLCASSLTEDFGELFNNKEYSDFIIQREKKTFYVHKAVLAVRSSYLASLCHKMKERKDGGEYFKDIKLDVLELVLRYLYTGDIAMLPMKSLKDVFAAADKFEMESLKTKCVNLFVNYVMTVSDDDIEETPGNKTDEKPKDEEIEDEEDDEEDDDEENEEQNESETDKSEEYGILKELFMTREWKLFHQKFPQRAREMCQIYLWD